MVTKKENYDAEVIYRFAAALVLGSTLMAAEPASAAGGGGYGPNARRGPWGHCRNTPYYGRLPNGSWKFRQAYNGCPPATGTAPGVIAATRRITAVC
jgi:hypothetical protein